MEQSPSLEIDSVLSESRNIVSFMQSEVSLPRSQQPAAGPYPQPDISILRPTILLPYDPFQYNPPICT
jgi:hypothetical protein